VLVLSQYMSRGTLLRLLEEHPERSAICWSSLPQSLALLGRRPWPELQTIAFGRAERAEAPLGGLPLKRRSSAPNGAPPVHAEAWIDIDRTEFRLDPRVRLSRLYGRYREQT
jgi:hypothetical protein